MDGDGNIVSGSVIASIDDKVMSITYLPFAAFPENRLAVVLDLVVVRNGRGPLGPLSLDQMMVDTLRVRVARRQRQWFRSYGNENREFDEAGLMRRRIASIDDLPIAESDRRFVWPLGRRPDDHPSLNDLGL